jgi:hypothetical protein
MKNLETKNNPAIDQFIIETTLIDPIAKIINQLENGEFRDCDIKWLDKKLEDFIKFAAETLGIKGIMPSSLNRESFTTLNDYVKGQYLTRFTTLLNYFKSF